MRIFKKYNIKDNIFKMLLTNTQNYKSSEYQPGKRRENQSKFREKSKNKRFRLKRINKNLSR